MGVGSAAGVAATEALVVLIVRGGGLLEPRGSTTLLPGDHVDVFWPAEEQPEAGAHSLTDLLVVVLVAEAAAHGMAGEARGIADSVLLIASILGWSVALDAIGMVSVLRVDRAEPDEPRSHP